MINKKKANTNRSFILRMWNDEPDHRKPPQWRFVLLDSECEQRRGFTSLDQLFATLCIEISEDTLTESTNANILREVEEILRSGH